jgi:type IV pilus assembly protein PilE
MSQRRVRGVGPSTGGFTLIEVLCVLALAAVLAAIAYPTYRSVVLKLRRSDGLAWLLQVQLAQERHRANHPRYATLAELGLPTTSPQGHYVLAVDAVGPSGYQLLAAAQGAQGSDTDCQYLRLTVAGGDVIHSSGADALTGNPAEENRRCWGQ